MEEWQATIEAAKARADADKRSPPNSNPHSRKERTMKTRDGFTITAYGLCGSYSFVTIRDAYGLPVTYFEPAFHSDTAAVWYCRLR